VRTRVVQVAVVLGLGALLALYPLYAYIHRPGHDHEERVQRATFTVETEAAFALDLRGDYKKHWRAFLAEAGVVRYYPLRRGLVAVHIPAGSGTAWWFGRRGGTAYAVTNFHVVSPSTQRARTRMEETNARYPVFYGIVASAVAVCPNFTHEYTVPSCLVDFGVVRYTDPNLDLAILGYVVDSATQVETLEMGDERTMREGDPIFLVGSPAGVAGIVARGVWLDRPFIQGGGPFQWVTPHDLNIMGGYSGGAVVDARSGRVVALINSALVQRHSGRNIGMAIPISLIRQQLALAGFPVGEVQLKTRGVR
jgi:hypothetical protein